MFKFVIAFGLCLLPASTMSLNAAPPSRDSWALTGLRPSVEAEAKHLLSKLIKIDTFLFKNAPWHSSAEEKLELVQQLLESPDWKQRLMREAIEKQALETLLSMKDLAGSCEPKTMRVFETFMAAMERAKFDSEINLIFNIVNHYRKVHAEKCAPVYKQAYEKLVQSLEGYGQQAQNFERVHVALDGLDAFDFSKIELTLLSTSTESRMKKMISMPDFTIEKDAIRSLHKIAHQIKSQLLKTSSDRNSIEELSHDDTKLKAVFDEHLFGPCTEYRTKLGPVLEDALVLATIGDDKQFVSFKEDPGYFHTVFNYGFCGKLRAEQDQLYEKLFEEWREIPLEFLERNLLV